MQGMSALTLALALVATPSTSQAAPVSDDGSCFSGGPGSSSCSISVGAFDCSVTCNAPFYACCTIGVNCNCSYAQ
jgi:hypothetical protein